ncbi:hypothetical protein Tco_0678090 [Tanacetum coccineum]|uniref:Uncharacterized protein n=1 Tax=Tanacetum coccineum TaxID=301880 RepID=A0ABQ4XFE3_9ASTR
MGMQAQLITSLWKCNYDECPCLYVLFPLCTNAGILAGYLARVIVEGKNAGILARPSIGVGNDAVLRHGLRLQPRMVFALTSIFADP